MESDRDAFCERLGAVPLLPLDHFLRHFLPGQKLTSKQLEQVMSKLTQKSRTSDHSDEENVKVRHCSQKWETMRAPFGADAHVITSWDTWAQLPSPFHDLEKNTYSDLVDLHGHIVQCCLEVNDKLKQTLMTVQSCESFKARSEEEQRLLPGGVHQPIAEKDSILDWHNVVVVEEYDHMRNCGREALTSRTSPMSIDKSIANSKKVLWSMHQILRTDHRRRFTFGVTFADTEVRLWNLSRAVAVVSEPFDLNTDAQVLVDVYSRFAFATLEELGFDPNIELLRNHPSTYSGQPQLDQYRITVCGEAYITLELFANHAAERGLGKCTRVYRTYKASDALIDPKARSHYVIKDCWVQSGRRTEYEIYGDIMKRIEDHDWQGLYDAAPTNITDLLQFEAESKSTRPADPMYGLSVEERKKFFVKVVSGEKVKVGGVIDDTHEVIGRGCSFPIESRKVYSVCERAMLRVGEEPVLCGVATYKHGVETGLPVQIEGRFLRDIPALQHHRIVMEEGQGFLDNPEIKSVFATVKDASYALFLLHSVGLVYGDVSHGNILRRPNGRGVLADFESVRSVDDPALCTMRTACPYPVPFFTPLLTMRKGTPDFCALEVVLGEFLVGQPLRNNAKRAFRDPDEPKATSTPPPRSPDSPLTWKFRDAHDLESFFWLVLWLLLRHRTNLPVPPKYDFERRYTDDYTEIFPHTFYNSPARFRALADAIFLDQVLSTLPPEWIKYMKGAMAILREELWEVYRARNKPLPPTLWAMTYLTCAMGERISGKFVPPVDEGILNAVIDKRDPRLIPATEKEEILASSTSTPTSSAASKRRHEEVEEAVSESECTDEERLTERQPKRNEAVYTRGYSS
ncbi:hypothetical protein EV121DRAFT_292990 [Schizophyllum commune]